MSSRNPQRTGFLFALPALLALALLIVYPLLHTAALSAMDDSGRYVGSRNYERIVASSVTLAALWNTFYYVGASLVLQMTIGAAVGIMLNQKFRARGLARSLILVPWIVPGIVAATTWAWMFHSEFGIVNYMLQTAGVVDGPVGWLTSPQLVLPSLIAVNVWKMFPFVAVMVLAGLQAVPDSRYEAARMDGANFMDEVRYVMIPHLRPILFAITLLLLIWGLNGITLIYAMTKGGPANRSLITPIQIYKQAFEFFRFGEAAALSVMFFGVVLVLIAIYIWLLGRRSET
ncbi:sugar ABC transporter permease [Terrarubrum flagellatum]|uniref:carbohydrate ABC transporter permease n=1 Tax=Terrirubrum flagellatum TaxID=2895980 RepID=UPI0031452DD7